jgi:hypothetical protein
MKSNFTKTSLFLRIIPCALFFNCAPPAADPADLADERITGTLEVINWGGIISNFEIFPNWSYRGNVSSIDWPSSLWDHYQITGEIRKDKHIVVITGIFPAFSQDFNIKHPQTDFVGKLDISWHNEDYSSITASGAVNTHWYEPWDDGLSVEMFGTSDMTIAIHK